MKIKTFNINKKTKMGEDIENLKKLKRLSKQSIYFILNDYQDEYLKYYYTIFLYKLKSIPVKQLKAILKVNPELLEILI